MKKYQLIQRVNGSVKFTDNCYGCGYTEEEAHRALDRWVNSIIAESRDNVMRFDDDFIAEIRAEHNDPCTWYKGEGWYYTDPEELLYRKGSDHFSFDTTTIDIEEVAYEEFLAEEMMDKLFGEECNYTLNGDEPIEVIFTKFTAEDDAVRARLEPNEFGADPIHVYLTPEQCKMVIERKGIRINHDSGLSEWIDF